MRTEPMTHQLEGLRRLADNPEAFALSCEQGTGKTWMLLADAERQWRDNRIDALLVIAPKGAHTNWTRREIPTHCDFPLLADSWTASAGKKRTRKMERVLERHRIPRDEQHTNPPAALVVFSMNIDAIASPKGWAFVKRFLAAHPRVMAVVDESQRIKNPKAARTKRAQLISEHPSVVSRRIASGTLIPNSPVDVFAQFEFLRSGLLGTTSFRAFTARYAELLPADSRLVMEAARRSRFRGASPQIVRRDEDGRPMYRNLDDLSKRMAPYMYRVLKRDCLDLPPKVYRNHYFTMPPAQRRVYDAIADDRYWLDHDGDIHELTALTVVAKLQQAACGYLLGPDGHAQDMQHGEARLAALREVVEDIDGQFIIWAVRREELRMIAELLEEQGISAVSYHGGVSDGDRDAAVDAFQSGEARAFVANPATAGRALTLTAASVAVYFSCSFDFEERSQSEDRCHRIGTAGEAVLYIDIVAEDTVDERIAAALQTKEGTAVRVLDPDRRAAA